MAHLVENVEDILENLGEVGAALRKSTEMTRGSHEDTKNHQERRKEPPSSEKVPESGSAMTEVQRRILAAMDGAAVGVEEVIERTGLAAGVVMAELTMLQIHGAIGRAGGNRFVKAQR
jgi:predicted Rossmann fold nucleotide-binding protein DprA/Smf involved in DNA uptake